MLKAKELRDHTIPDLTAMLDETKKNLFKLVNQQKEGKKGDKSHLVKEKKKDIAKLLTVMREKTLA